jgi:prevent-host-death family protein
MLITTTAGIFEAKNRLSELVERAARGEHITITRRGEAVARLMPPEAADKQDQARKLAARISLETAVGRPCWPETSTLARTWGVLAHSPHG